MKCVAVAAAKDDEDCYDGERRFVVYSGSLDGSVKVWRLSEDRPLADEPAAPQMPVLLESEAWTTPRRAVALAPPPAQAWAPYQQAPPELMKRVATFAAAITATGGEEEAGDLQNVRTDGEWRARGRGGRRRHLLMEVSSD